MVKELVPVGFPAAVRPGLVDWRRAAALRLWLFLTLLFATLLSLCYLI